LVNTKNTPITASLTLPHQFTYIGRQSASANYSEVTLSMDTNPLSGSGQGFNVVPGRGFNGNGGFPGAASSSSLQYFGGPQITTSTPFGPIVWNALSGSIQYILYYNRDLTEAEIEQNNKFYYCNNPISTQPITTTSTTTTAGPTTTTTLGPTTTTLAPTTTTTTSTTSTTSTTTTLAPTTTTTTASPLTTTGLVSWYSCDSLSGSTWFDKSGNGNNAQVSGSLLTSYNSEGYLFNSTNYVVWPETINNIPSGSWTLQFQGFLRANLVGSQTVYDLWCKEDYSNGWDTVVKTTVGLVNYNYIFRDEGGFDKDMQSNDTWYTWLVTITCNATTNDTKLYLNGTFIANGDAGDVTDFNSASTKRLVFGYNSNTDAKPFGFDNENRVKDLLLYNKVLSAGEVASNYNYLNSYTCSVAP
jgi:hypothetical protein